MEKRSCAEGTRAEGREGGAQSLTRVDLGRGTYVKGERGSRRAPVRRAEKNLAEAVA